MTIRNRRTLKHLALLALVGGVLALAACSGDNSVSKSQYDRVRQQLQDTENQQQQLQAQLAAAQKAAPSAAAAAPAASATSAPAAAAQASPAAAGSGVKLLLGSVKATPAPPPPTPAPGTTPAPRPTPPPSLYESVGPYYVYVEVLATTSPGASGIVSNIACTPSSVFSRGQKIVWRYEIVDTSTGKRVTNLDGATVKVLLPNDVVANGSFSQRGGGSVPGAPFMWTSNWEIPQDYPLGAIAYSIQITSKDGQSFTWSPPAIQGANEDSRPKVVA